MDYKRVLLLHFTNGLSSRDIAEATGAGKTTTNEFLKRFRECKELSYPLPEEVTNEFIESLLYQKAGNPVRSDLYRDFDPEEIHRALAKKDETLKHLWKKYNAAGTVNGRRPLSYRQFCRRYTNWLDNIVSMAKAMGGGMPISAICATEEVSKAFSPGTHDTTFGGHPVSCAAAYAEINELLDRDLAGNAKKMGDYFCAKLEKLPHVKEVRHQGLLVGVEFDDSISGIDVKHECLHRHLLITAIGAHVIRMIPPLIITEEDCDTAVGIIHESVQACKK